MIPAHYLKLPLSEADPVSRTQEYVRQQTEFNKGMKQASFNPEQFFKMEGDTIELAKPPQKPSRLALRILHHKALPTCPSI